MDNSLLNISGKTRLLGLLGHPASHSISPKMHSLSAQILGLPYVYLSFDILPEDLGKAVDAMRTLGARGFNLTMPHKVAIIPFLDRMSDDARLSGAVNTVVIEEDGSLFGDTTDGRGFLAGIKANGFSYEGRIMTLLGAGGAATSVCVSAALGRMSEIRIFKRKNASFEDTVSFAQKLSEQSSCKVTVNDIGDMNDLKTSIDESDILVNATNVGMSKNPVSLVPKDFLRNSLFVCDIIYEPRQTQLIKDASEVGAGCINGLPMLLYQGAASFELWTGEKMPVDEIKDIIFKE